MQRRKLLNEYSVEELSNIANDEKQELILDNGDVKSSILIFINDYQLTPGKELIKFKRLYDLYTITTNSDQPLTYNKFVNEIKQFFETERRGSNYYLLINKSSLNLSKEVQKQLIDLRIFKKQRKLDGYFQKQFNEFKQIINLQKGNTYIKRSVIYYFYDLWAYRNKKHKMSMKTFYILLRKEGLIVKHNRLTYCVKINKDVFTPYEKTLQEATAWVKKRYKAEKD